MDKPTSGAAETRAYGGVIGGILVGIATGLIGPFVDAALAVLQSPSPTGWTRLVLDGVLILFTAIPGLFVLAAAWPTATSNAFPIKVAGVLIELVVAIDLGTWYLVR